MRERRRYILAGIALVLTAVLLVTTGGLPGQGADVEPTGIAVLTAEAWVGGEEPRAWAPVVVPERVATLLVSPDDIAAERVVAARDLPSGTLLQRDDLTTELESGPGAVLTTVGATFTGWPAVGATAGARAMLVDASRGCATHAVTLLGIEGSSVVVAAERELGLRLEAGAPWRVLPAPAQPDALERWMCPPQDPGQLVVPVEVDLSALSGGPLSPGEMLMLAPGDSGGQLCAEHVVHLWGVRGGGRIEVAASRTQAQELVRVASAAGWRAVRLPTDGAVMEDWQC